MKTRQRWMGSWSIIAVISSACGAGDANSGDETHVGTPGATSTPADAGTSGDSNTASDSDADGPNPSSTPDTTDAGTSSSPPDTVSESGRSSSESGNAETNDAAGPTCGDGIVEGDEACDDGELSAVCNADCTLADCGDAYHNPVAGEGCDDGNVVANDGCSSFCALEDFPYRIAFVTSTVHTGDLGGLEGADTICNQLSGAAELPGTYLAWLSDAMYSPSLRFSQADVPYRRVDGIQIADDWADLVDGTLDYPLDMTETEEPTPGDHFPCNLLGDPSVWTGTDADGTRYQTYDCEGWTSEKGSAAWGWTYSAEDWSLACYGGGCDAETAFYCFQQ